MIAFIDDHRRAYGVEPICKLLPIAPSTYNAHVAKRADPSRLSERIRRDLALKVAIRRVFAENFRVYGVRKVWLQLNREGVEVARCTVARLMRKWAFMASFAAGQCGQRSATKPRLARWIASTGNSRPRARTTLGVGLYLCLDVGRHGLCRFRHRHLCPTDCWMAGQSDGSRHLCPRCA